MTEDAQREVRAWERGVRRAWWAWRGRTAALYVGAWISVLLVLLAWPATGDWRVGAGGIALFLLVVVVSTLVEHRADVARYEALHAAYRVELAAYEARRARSPERVGEEFLANARAGIDPWLPSVRRWLQGAPVVDVPAGTGVVEAGGRRYEVTSVENVARWLGHALAFPDDPSPACAFAWSTFPADYGRALVRTSPRRAVASVYRTPAGDVALAWEDVEPPAADPAS